MKQNEQILIWARKFIRKGQMNGNLLQGQDWGKKLGEFHILPLLTRMESDPLTSYSLPSLYLSSFLPFLPPSSFSTFFLPQILKYLLNIIWRTTASYDMIRTSKQAELCSKEIPPEESNHRHCTQRLLKLKGNLHETKTS